jgi:hypothetical protein
MVNQLTEGATDSWPCTTKLRPINISNCYRQTGRVAMYNHKDSCTLQDMQMHEYITSVCCSKKCKPFLSFRSLPSIFSHAGILPETYCHNQHTNCCYITIICSVLAFSLHLFDISCHSLWKRTKKCQAFIFPYQSINFTFPCRYICIWQEWSWKLKKRKCGKA